jgi:hypothetical protein
LRFTFCVLPFVASAFQTPAAAQSAAPRPPPVRLEVEVGYNGLIRAGRLAPVRVTIDNDGDATSGRVEIRSEDGLDQTETEVALPRGARKRYTAYVLPRESGKETKASFSIRLMAGRRVLAQRSVTVNRVSPSALVALSLTGDGAGLQFLDGVEWVPYRLSAQRRQLRAVHLSPGDFPNSSAALAEVDVVAVNGRGWSALDSGQRRALRQWVEQGGTDPESAGGRAILCGDLPSDWQDEDAAALCAIRPSQPESFRRLESLAAWTGAAFASEGGGSILGVTGPAVGEGETWLSEAGTMLARRRNCARGAALWIGFDTFGQAFRSWDQRPAFWHAALQAVEPPLPPGVLQVDPIETYGSVRSAAEALPQLAAPPLGALIGFAIVYAFVFGPLNIVLLRRLRRTVRAWLLMPAIAATMTLALVAIGQSWSSNRTILNVITVLDSASGARSARQQTRIGLFSPTNRTFDVTVEDPAPRFERLEQAEAGTPAGEAAGAEWPTRQEDGRVIFEGEAQALYSIIDRRVERPVELRGSIIARLRAGVHVQVANNTPLTLRRCAIWHAWNRTELGDLPPGASRTAPMPLPTDPPPEPAASPDLRTAPGERMADIVAEISRGQSIPLRRVHPGKARTEAAPRERAVPDVRSVAGWLVAEVPNFDPGIGLNGIAANTRLTLLLVRIEGGTP